MLHIEAGLTCHHLQNQPAKNYFKREKDEENYILLYINTGDDLEPSKAVNLYNLAQDGGETSGNSTKKDVQETDFVKSCISVGYNEAGVAIYSCQLCERSFQRSMFYIKRHFESVHVVSERVPCDTCNKMFKNKNCLKDHYSRFHNTRWFTITCQLCDRRYSRVDHFKMHCTLQNALRLIKSAPMSA